MLPSAARYRRRGRHRRPAARARAAGRRLCCAVAATALAAGSGVVVLLPGSPADAGAGDGTLTVQIVRDVNGNGTLDAATDFGVAGAGVTVRDDAGRGRYRNYRQ